MKKNNVSHINIWPYLNLALQLKNLKRKGVGNMFRHQVETFTILFEYGYTDPVLLKASFIHDILEDGPNNVENTSEIIRNLDEDGNDVLKLVEEMSIKIIDNIKEPKSEYLLRIMKSGSVQAKLLKLADRISNVSSLTVINNIEFIERYLKETEDYILPYAESINKEMGKELLCLVELKMTLIFKNKKLI